MDSPKTLQAAILYFADVDRCREFLMDLRWPDGNVTCPTCGSERVIYMPSVRRWKCYAKHAGPQFSLKTGTIFEDSPLGLDKWLAALWLLVNCKNGISSCEIARAIGITQKSAWFMAHRLRFALRAVSTSVRQPVSEFTEAPPRARSGKGPGRREAVAVCL